MGAQRGVALIADSFPASAAASRSLLSARGWSVAACLSDGREVLPAVRAHTAELVLLDAVLPGVDGATAALELLRAPLSVRPAVLVASPPGFPLPRPEALLEVGAALLEKPLTPEALDAALEETSLPLRRVPGDARKRLEALFDRLGLPDRPGRAYLRDAILFAWQDARLTGRLTGGLYPMVAARNGVDVRKVERDMRRTIEHAWKYGRIDEQYAIFGGTIDAQRGKPTCGELIAHLTDILRLEG